MKMLKMQNGREREREGVRVEINNTIRTFPNANVLTTLVGHKKLPNHRETR